MRRLLKVVFCLALSLTISAEAFEIEADRVGYHKNIKVHTLTPGAVIMQDAQKNDVLVVFYRTKSDKHHHNIGFSIARSLDKDGMLVWDQRSYVLPTSVISTGAVAPLPLMHQNRLYLFGTEKVGHDQSAKNRVFYNHFDSLETLINTADSRKGSAPKKLFDTNRNHPALTGINITIDGKPQLMFAYYHPKKQKGEPEQPPYSYALCQISTSTDLSCTLNDAYRGLGHEMISGLTLYNLKMGRDQTILLASRHRHSHQFSLYQYDLNEKSWAKLYNVSHLTPGVYPVGFAQKGYHLITYFKNDHGHNSYPDASIIRAQGSLYDIPYVNTAWLNGVSVYDKNETRLKSNSGISTVVYKGQIFGFYKEKHQPYLSYFREKD